MYFVFHSFQFNRWGKDLEQLIFFIIMIPVSITVGAATIGLGIKRDGTWLLRRIFGDLEFESLLKPIFNPENKI